jgi:putative transposase
LQTAFSIYGCPEIINSDQGCQFTSDSYTGQLKEKGIKISMDSKGRALDNIYIERLWRSVKQENIYINCYQTDKELCTGLNKYFTFYNNERPHCGINNRRPKEKYRQTNKVA